MTFEEQVLDDKLVFKGHVVELHQQKVLLPNHETSEREIIRHPGAVGILALIDERRALLVRQWRAPLGKETLEIPAGKLEPTDTSPLATAKRELNEELGLAASSWKQLTGFYSSPGFADEYLTLYVARGLTSLEHKRALDPDEFLVGEVWPLTEIITNSTGQFDDAKTLLAVSMWLLQQKG